MMEEKEEQKKLRSKEARRKYNEKIKQLGGRYRNETPEEKEARNRKCLENYYKRKQDPSFVDRKNESCRKSYRRHRDKIISRTGDYAEKRKKDMPEYALLYGAKSRAKKKGLDFNLDIDDIIIPEYCPILNIPIIPKQSERGKKGRPTPNSPSLDRVDNSKGYVKGNVRVISYRANTSKTDLGIEDIIRLYNYIQDHLSDAHSFSN